MKQLTYSAMAAARLRGNKRGYRSLVLGIFLSIFLISTLVLSVYAIYQESLQKRYDKVGVLDMVVLDNAIFTDEAAKALGDFDRVGHAYLSGWVTEKNIYLGYYDETGRELLKLTPLEGRMPEVPGEIAVEASALEVLEADWQLGQTVELPITPVDGVEETRQFTLVGFLPERSVYLEKTGRDGVEQFPAMVTCPEEPAFSTGRIAVHYMMGLKKGVSLSEAIERFADQYINEGLYYWDYYGLSTSGEQVQFYRPSDITFAEREMLDLIFMACVLAAALILSCGIGISGAMEGLLTKRREEIGVLRALGATRRQIRRMFGRENLLLGLVVSPVSIAVSCLAVWILSVALPESMKFAFHIGLMLPIGVFSVVVIFLSGYLPLARASRQMPMSVIRDTAMLRRSKGIKYQKSFSPPKLIASRQIRFHPTRQLGAALLVGLMLLCSGMLTGLILSVRSMTGTDYPGFEIHCDRGALGSYVRVYPSDPMPRKSLDQLRSLAHVKYIRIRRGMPILAQLDTVPRYAMVPGNNEQLGMLDEAGLQQALPYYGSGSPESAWEHARPEYMRILKDYQFPGQVFRTAIVTVELDAETLDMLKQNLSEGSIDADAINSGEQVLVYAPDIWVEGGLGFHTKFYTSEEARNSVGENAQLVAWNDCFSAGQSLPLTQLYSTEEGGTVYREDAAVQVAGVVTQLDRGKLNVWNDTAIITTEAGLENMGLRMEGLHEVRVYLDGEITPEVEETLERQITAISRRTEGLGVFNVVERMRQIQREDRQQILLIFAIVTVFFAVAVGMIVSSVTRQLNAEGRTIGMLRAVGADERAILDCYTGQVNAGIFGGLGLCAAVLAVFLGADILEAIARHGIVWDRQSALLTAVGIVTILAMAAGCYAVCRLMLRFRIREIVSKSIIENIREL